MATIRVDLDKAIDDLERSLAELKDYLLNLNDPDQEDQLAEKRLEIVRELGVLRQVRTERGASSITVTAPSDEETTALSQALGALHIIVQNEEAFAHVLTTAQGLLDAATAVSGKVS
jgi:hypothetical protein